MLTLQDLNVWYGAAQVLFDVSLRVRRGEKIAAERMREGDE